MPDEERPLADLAARERAMSSTIARLRARPPAMTSLGLGDLAASLGRATADRRTRQAILAVAAAAVVLAVLNRRQRRRKGVRPDT